MAKTKLCCKDEGNLVEEMKAFANRLEEFGIVGTSSLTFHESGDITGTFFTDSKTVLRVGVEKNGDKKIVEYGLCLR